MSNRQRVVRSNADRQKLLALVGSATVACALLLSAPATRAQAVAVDAESVARAVRSGAPRPHFVEANRIPPALQARRDGDGPAVVLFDSSIKDRRSKQVAEQLSAHGAGNIAYLIGSPPQWRDIADVLPAKTQIEAPVRLSPSDLAALIADPTRPQIVDLRDPAAFKKGHLPGSINLQPHELENASTRLDANRWIVVVDASAGSVAAVAAERLFLAARPWVAWLDGGYEAWSKRGAAQQ